MSRAYKFHDQESPYFVTITIVDWISIFNTDFNRMIVVDSLKYCQQMKGLIIYAWVIMPNHLHLIIGTKNMPLEHIIRDFKSYTSRMIRKEMEQKQQVIRKSWMVKAFITAGSENSNNKDWQLWQQHNKPIELWDNYMIDQKLEYVHNNPVKAGFVNNAEEWRYSSAANYVGNKGIIDVVFID